MPNPVFAASVFAIQGTLLGLDEFRFHRARVLPRWERWGHPLDTLSVFVCFLLACLAPAAAPWTGMYITAAVFSCLCVTKDEWVHREHCTAAEHWLHALLFLLHPVLLWAAYVLWRGGGQTADALLGAQAALVFGFGLYQTWYWNFAWPRRPQ
jgi:hypothetical protein